MKDTRHSNERARLRLIRSILLPLEQVPTIVGLAEPDDAAVVATGGAESVILTTDFIRGTEFLLFKAGHLDYFDLGYYLVASNVSDIAAMGMRPSGLLTVVRYGPDVTDDDLDYLTRGIAEGCQTFGTSVVGGDLGSNGFTVLAATAFALGDPQKVLKRSGAKVGDVLCLSGSVGGAIGALLYFLVFRQKYTNLSPQLEQEFLNCWRRPNARVDVGILLSKYSLASSCLDVSDGLRSSLEDLCASSRVGINVDKLRLPFHRGLREICNAHRLDVAGVGMSASVDFELVFTIPAERIGEARQRFQYAKLELHEIGVVTTSDLGCTITLEGGTIKPLPGVGWDHQSDEFLADVCRAAAQA